MYGGENIWFTCNTSFGILKIKMNDMHWSQITAKLIETKIVAILLYWKMCTVYFCRHPIDQSNFLYDHSIQRIIPYHAECITNLPQLQTRTNTLEENRNVTQRNETNFN